MEAKENKKYTADEFLSMPDTDGRYELIGGEIYDMSAAPNIKHQTISGRIFSQIFNYIDRLGGKCRVFAAPTDVKLSDDSVVQPDIFVVCDPEKLDEYKCCGAPDWIIEITSPSNTRRDTQEKLYLYSEYGVKEYWIVDPIDERVVVYDFGASNTTGIYTFSDEIPAGIYKNEREPLNISLKMLSDV